MQGSPPTHPDGFCTPPLCPSPDAFWALRCLISLEMIREGLSGSCWTLVEASQPLGLCPCCSYVLRQVILSTWTFRALLRSGTSYGYSFYTHCRGSQASSASRTRIFFLSPWAFTYLAFHRLFFLLCTNFTDINQLSRFWFLICTNSSFSVSWNISFQSFCLAVDLFQK